jgi:hypothetical protein
VNRGGGQVNDARCRIWWLLSERVMWTVAVVVSHVLPEDRHQMSLAGDEYPVGAFSTYRACPALANAFARGACGGVLITSMPSAVVADP